MTKQTFGKIIIRTSYAMDGEYFKSINEYNVIVTNWWGKGEFCNQAKEVKMNDIYYRQTKKNGWREYNKLRTPRYIQNTIKQITFIPNKYADISNNMSSISL